MSNIRIPVVRTERVLHIGTLQASLKGRHFGSSLEGHCLSVSHCPHAWRDIARLGGNTLWALENPRGVFLDAIRVARNARLRRLIEAWGVLNGFSGPEIRWKVWSTDEDGEWRYILCGTEQDALWEAEDGENEQGPRGGPVVEAVQVLTGTHRLCQRVGLVRMDDLDAFDFLAMVWAEDTQPLIDGIWWRERYAPESLSAPRGGIFPTRLAQWKPHHAAFDAVSDCEGAQCLKVGFIAQSGGRQGVSQRQELAA